jgi:hypothetical protein
MRLLLLLVGPFTPRLGDTLCERCRLVGTTDIFTDVIITQRHLLLSIDISVRNPRCGVSSSYRIFIGGLKNRGGPYLYFSVFVNGV